MGARWVRTIALASGVLVPAACATRAAPSTPTPAVAPPAPVAPSPRPPAPASARSDEPWRPLAEVVALPDTIGPFVPLPVAGTVPPPVLEPTMPSSPAVVPPGRPAAGGTALELADLALLRGDAIDAAAQYRALLATATPSYAPYVRYQLARAHELLGDPGRARALYLDAARATGPVGWAALAHLAVTRASQIGAYATFTELRSLNASRVDTLAALLIGGAPPVEQSALLIELATLDGDCGHAFSAVLLGATLTPALQSRCGEAIAEARGIGVIAEEMFARQSARANGHLAAIERSVDRWNELAAGALAGDLDPRPWVELSEAYVRLRRGAPTTTWDLDLDLAAAAAALVAVDLARRQDWIDGDLLARLRRVLLELPGRVPSGTWDHIDVLSRSTTRDRPRNIPISRDVRER